MPEFDFTGLDQAAQGAFKPHFAEVESRARRRQRRTRVAGATALVAVVAAGVGVVSTSLGPGGQRSTGGGLVAGPGRTPDFIAPPVTPKPVADGEGRVIKPGRVVVGDVTHLYARYGDCREDDCAIMFAASDDRGATWRTSPMPVPNNSQGYLRVVGPRTLVIEVHTRPMVGRMIDASRTEQFWLSSTDGGATWQRVEITEVAVLPETFRPLESGPSWDSLPLLAADPATGKIVQLAREVPLKHARVIEGMPVSAGIWVTGHTGETVGPVLEENGSVSENKITFTGSAIEVSHDGGRTWRRGALPEEVFAGGNFGAADVAVHGDTAYAVGAVDGELRIYRSVDQGRTWRRTAAREHVGDRTIRVGVRADGTLLIQAGLLAPEDPIMFSSADRGETIQEIEVGPGASAVAVSGGYAQTGTQDSTGAWISENGTTWSYVDSPSTFR